MNLIVCFKAQNQEITQTIPVQILREIKCMSNLQMEPDYLGTNSINSVAFVVTVRSLEHRPHDSMIDTLRHIPHLKFIEEL